MKLKWSDVTPRSEYLNRRAFIAAGMASLATPALGLTGAPSAFSTDEKPNSLEDITNYNNFYEFGTDKEDPARHAPGRLKTRPWTVTVEGEIKRPRTFSIDAHGTTTRASADRAVSDGKGQNIELFGQVHAVRQRTAEGGGKNGTPPPVIFESSYLKATNRQEHLSTDQPVKITQGNDVITGTGMTYTGASRTVNIQGRSQAVIQPHRQP